MALETLYRDVSNVALVSGGCNVLPDNQTIVVFDTVGQQQITYKLVSNTYFKYSDIPYIEPDGRIGLVCQDDSVIQTLPSPYEFMLPFYGTMAILTMLSLFYIAYRFIVYPFFRKKG